MVSVVCSDSVWQSALDKCLYSSVINGKWLVTIILIFYHICLLRSTCVFRGKMIDFMPLQQQQRQMHVMTQNHLSKIPK